MNASQTGLMRWLDSQWAKHQHDAGQPCDRDARLAMYQRVSGRAVTSSKQLRNDDITEIKRHVLALVEPANFTAQLKSQEDNDPANRRLDLIARCDAAILILLPDDEIRCQPGFEADRRAAYLNAAAANFGGHVVHLDPDALRKLTHSLETRAAAKQRARDRAAAAHGDDDNPF